MNVVVAGIERHEVRDAVALIEEGTLSPGSEDPARLDDYWEAVLETRARGGDVVVARRDGHVVGVCQIIVFRHFQRTAGWCAELESVYVRSDLRSQGIGATILDYAEAFAATRGCYRVQLSSRNERDDAHRFYRTRGYDQNSQGFKKPLR